MFKIQSIFYTMFILLLLTGCVNSSTERNTSNEQPVQPIHYEENKDQTSQKHENVAERQYDSPTLQSFDREESAAFQNMVLEHEEVQDVRVVTTEDRVVVAVKMKKSTDSQDFEEISEDIKQILNTDKRLFIYNDVAKWERIKDFYARDEANEIGEDMEHLFQNLFE